MNREAYLTDFADKIIDRFLAPAGFETNSETGQPLSDKVRVSVGWPTTRALNKYGRTIGQCFHPRWSKAGYTEIFVSPYLDDVIQVGSTLVHELLHAALPFTYGHDHRFEAACLSIGLTGPATATVAGQQLAADLAQIVAEIGPYPHSAIDISMIPKATTRLLKCACVNENCPTQQNGGLVVRITWKWAKDLANGNPSNPTTMKPLPNGTTSYMFLNFPCPVCAENMALFLDTVNQPGGGGEKGKDDSTEAPDINTGSGEGGGETDDKNIVTPDNGTELPEDEPDFEPAEGDEDENTDVTSVGGGTVKSRAHSITPACAAGKNGGLCPNCERGMAAAFAELGV